MTTTSTRARATFGAGLLAITALAGGAFTGPATATTAPAPQIALVSMTSPATDLNPTGFCAAGHNPDGSCRGKKIWSRFANDPSMRQNNNIIKDCAQKNYKGVRNPGAALWAGAKTVGCSVSTPVHVS